MNARTALLAALVAPALTVLPAHAAVKKPVACLQVVDPAGDAKTKDGANHGAIDIRSADLATGKRNLVVVLRLASLASDPTMTTGAMYKFEWRAGGISSAVVLSTYQDGSYAASFDPNSDSSSLSDTIDATADIDTSSATITWTVPRENVPALKKPGTKFSGFSLIAEIATNLGTSAPVNFHFTSSGNSIGYDTATSGKTYVDKSATCLKGV